MNTCDKKIPKIVTTEVDFDELEKMHERRQERKRLNRKKEQIKEDRNYK